MIIFVGVSGAGKGTQSELLGRDTGYDYLSTGDILRAYASPEQKLKMLGGELLDDENMIAIVEAALRQQRDANKVILDGFPRTIAQASWLLDVIKRKGLIIDAVIHLQVSAAVVQSRLQGRGRQDDTQAAIAARIAWYERYTRPVVDFFKAHEIPVFDIDGSGATSAVYAIIKEKLNIPKPTKE